ncbi:hypothetical protein QWY16_01455 [Planococcus shenhongbingii]|uniref:hypothetical protein n=1 Tax=Planococcus shenhongbingii TaxID=3058398 RepID=UPI0026039CC1|nr:hypothetical protein [Planococcus sp. N016]WKA58849.1 hypothetical protein QWY16_01455 [Planococcus sp. N016]
MFNSLKELMEAKGYKDKRGVRWNEICQEEKLSEPFIRENEDQVNWKLVSTYQSLTEDFIREFSDRLFWEPVMAEQKVSEQFIEEFAKKEKWNPAKEKLSKRQLKTSERENRDFDGTVYWTIVSRKQELSNSKGLSPAFIEKHQEKLSWSCLSLCQTLPMSLIDRHSDKVDWNAITRVQALSERFIEKHRSRVEWETISFHQDLSERFINRHQAKMSFISAERVRSEAFLYTHLEKMDAASVIENQNLRNVKKYEPFDVYIVGKNGHKKYILKYHANEHLENPSVHIADEEELYEHLEEHDLDNVIEKDFPELGMNRDFRF